MKTRYVVLREHLTSEPGSKDKEAHFVIVDILEAHDRESAVDTVDAALGPKSGRQTVRYRAIPESQFDPEYQVRHEVVVERKVIGVEGKTRAVKPKLLPDEGEPTTEEPAIDDTAAAPPVEATA